MGLRELIILLLGLVAVGVILQGFYVAIQARRNQIRVAIDNNIPEDFDLEDIELAELPGGGARKVVRHLEDNAERSENPQELGESRSIASVNCFSEATPDSTDGFEYGEETKDMDTDSRDFYEGDNVVEDYSYLVTQNTGDREVEENRFSERLVEKDYADLRAAERFDVASIENNNPPYDEKQSYEIGEGTEISENVHESEFSGYDKRDFVSITGTNQDAEVQVIRGAGEIDSSELGYEKEYEQLAAKNTLDNASDYYGLGHDNDERYLSDPSQEEDHEARDDEVGKSSFEDNLEQFSMTAGERIGYDQKLSGEVFKDEYKDSRQYDTVDSVARESVKPSRLKSLLGLLKRESINVNSHIGIDGKDLPEENYNILGQAAEEAEIIEELEDFFDGEDVTDDLIASADESAKEVGSLTPTQLGSDNLARLKPDASPSIVSPEINAERLGNGGISCSSEVLVINVMSREDGKFSGDELLKSLVDNGLVFGEMNIFHCYANQGNEDAMFFSVANILHPGTFDLYNMHEFSTIGISLFLSLPTDFNNLEAFENMIGVAKKICESLDGVLKDDHRNLMTAQTIEHYRQRIRDFELLQLKTAISQA